MALISLPKKNGASVKTFVEGDGNDECAIWFLWFGAHDDKSRFGFRIQIG